MLPNWNYPWRHFLSRASQTYFFCTTADSWCTGVGNFPQRWIFALQLLAQVVCLLKGQAAEQLQSACWSSIAQAFSISRRVGPGWTVLCSHHGTKVKCHFPYTEVLLLKNWGLDPYWKDCHEYSSISLSHGQIKGRLEPKIMEFTMIIR